MSRKKKEEQIETSVEPAKTEAKTKTQSAPVVTTVTKKWCGKCLTQMIVYTTKESVQYLKCPVCGETDKAIKETI